MYKVFIQRYSLNILLSLCGLTLYNYSYAQSNTHNANHLVAGIMSYTSWENAKEQINFCIVDGPAKFITPNIFTPPSPLIQPNKVKILSFTTNELNTALNEIRQNECDVLYFVNTQDSIQQKIISNSTPRSLSMSENNPDCTLGSAFCLSYRNQKFAFQVNLNNLKKSKVRVNSKVLMLSQSGGDTE